MNDEYMTTESYFDSNLINLEAELDYGHGDNSTTKLSVPKKCVDDSKEWKMFQTLFLCFGSSFIIIAGTGGNVVAYCVLNQRGYKGNVMAQALRYLACLDTLILWTAVLDIFFKGAFNFDLSSTSYELCAVKLAYVLIVTSIDCWLLVVISATRLIFMSCPVKGLSLCTKFNYVVCIVLVHLIVVGIHSSAFYAIYLRFPKGKLNTMCYFAVTNITKGTMFIPINMGTNFVGPFSSLTIINILMFDCPQRALKSVMLRLCKSCVVETNEKDNIKALLFQEKNRNFQRSFMDVPARAASFSSSSTNQAPHHQDSNANHMDGHDGSTPTDNDTMSKALKFDAQDGKDKNPEERQVGFEATDDTANDKSHQDNSVRKSRLGSMQTTSRDSNVKSLTRVLMVANFVYFAVSLPFWVFHLFLRKLVLKHITGCYLRELIPYIGFLLQYSNHGLNFYFYCASGKRFRQDLMSWLRSFRK